MSEYKLSDMEIKFADIIWENEPIESGNLVKICGTKFNWKKSTTYTMLKRLETKGIFQNKNGFVSSLLSRDEFFSKQSLQFVENNFKGSLPLFLAAFTKFKKLSDKEIKEINQLIQEHKEGE